MKNKAVEEKNKTTDNQRVNRSSHQKSSMVKNTEINPVYAELAGEGHEDFYNYLDWLGLAKSPDLLILASSHHYYFEIEDLKNVRTVVSLKRLNNLTKPKGFLQARSFPCSLISVILLVVSATVKNKVYFLEQKNILVRSIAWKPVLK